MFTATAPAQPVEHLTGVRRVEDLPDLIPIPTLSEFTGLSVPTLARWRMERTSGVESGPKFVKLGAGPGARVRYRRADVLVWIESLADVG